MNHIEIENHALFKVDVEKGSAIQLAINSSADDVQSYARRILSELLDSPRSRSFRFINMAELVPAALKDICGGGNWDEKSSAIACKLYDVEVDVQERIEKLGQTVRKGDLLQLKISVDGAIMLVIVKIDEDEYLDNKELEYKTGLPTSKTRLQKAALVRFNNEGDVEELLLSDSKPTISEYWYRYFLMAEQLTSSETNTKNAFEVIDKLLNKEVKPVSPMDYWFLRNEVVNYFRNEASLVFDELVERVKKHKVESNEFEEKFPEFIRKFSALPRQPRKPFDTQFDLEPSVIKARVVKKVMLDANFELRINGEIKDLQSKLSTGEDQKGKFIKIYSDNGFEAFSKDK